MTIELENIELYARHGCYDLEKVVGGRFRVDLAVEVCSPETDLAAQEDNVRGLVNYLDLVAIVEEQMAITSDTIEHVALRIADAIRAHSEAITSARVKVSKLAPPTGGKIARVSVTVSR